LNGLFPPQSPNELITIERGQLDAEILRPSGALCKDMQQVGDTISSDETHMARIKEHWQTIKHIAEYLELDFSPANVSLIADWVGTHNCVDRVLPSIVGEADIANCHAIVAESMYIGCNKNATVFVSYAMREVLRIAAQSVNQESKLKFSLLSAHDSTVSSFLCYLTEFDQSRIPPYASHVLMEIWTAHGGKKFVRWVYNGRVLKLKRFDGREVVSYDEFVDGTKDVYRFCTELP
jgi:acid phosphatase